MSKMMATNWTPQDKLAWQRQRIAEHVAKGQLEATPQIKAFIAGKPMPPNAPAKLLNIQATVSANASAKAGKAEDHITVNKASTCFSDLEWNDGVATATFAKGGGAGTYDYEMSREGFLDWASDDSLGEYFNTNIR